MRGLPYVSLLFTIITVLVLLGQGHGGVAEASVNGADDSIINNSNEDLHEAGHGRRSLQAAPNVIIQWNQFLLELIRTSKTAPPKAAYVMALMHTAIFDSVNGIVANYTTYRFKPAFANAAASKEAAIAQAA